MTTTTSTKALLTALFLTLSPLAAQATESSEAETTENQSNEQLNENIEKAKETKRIKRTRVSLRATTGYVLVASSDGRIVEDVQPMTDLGISCTAEQDGRREDNGASSGSRRGIEAYTTKTLREQAGKARSDEERTAIRREIERHLKVVEKQRVAILEAALEVSEKRLDWARKRAEQ